MEALTKSIWVCYGCLLIGCVRRCILVDLIINEGFNFACWITFYRVLSLAKTVWTHTSYDRNIPYDPQTVMGRFGSLSLTQLNGLPIFTKYICMELRGFTKPAHTSK